jgi:hypothetical protein
MPDIECPKCGHRALSVATRCPRCGFAFPAELLQPPAGMDRGWGRGALGIGGAVAVVMVLALLGRRGGGTGEPDPAAGMAADALVPGGVTPARDTLPAKASAAPVTPRASPELPPTPAPATGMLRRYARTWVNVRESRSARAGILRVLQPGDAIQVDSLSRGWYRVVDDGRSAGYAHRALLGAAPPGSTVR